MVAGLLSKVENNGSLAATDALSNSPRIAEKKYLPRMFKVLVALLFLLLLYLVIFIFTRGWWPAGIFLTVLFFITFGYYKFVRR